MGLFWLMEVLNKAWSDWCVAEVWREAGIVPLYKGKENKRECKNNVGLTGYMKKWNKR